MRNSKQQSDTNNNRLSISFGKYTFLVKGNANTSLTMTEPNANLASLTIRDKNQRNIEATNGTFTLSKGKYSVKVKGAGRSNSLIIKELEGILSLDAPDPDADPPNLKGNGNECIAVRINRDGVQLDAPDPDADPPWFQESSSNAEEAA